VGTGIDECLVAERVLAVVIDARLKKDHIETDVYAVALDGRASHIHSMPTAAVCFGLNEEDAKRNCSIAMKIEQMERDGVEPE
jgi:hypothetical protein